MNDEVTTDLRFSFVPAWLLNRDISDKALRLYAVLAGYADSETGQAFPGRSLLARRMSCSLKTVDRAVAELLELGAIRKQQRVKDGHYQSSLYTVVRIDPASGMTRPRVTDDPTPRHTRRDPVSWVTHRTITTELEPEELEPHNYLEAPKRAQRLPADWTPSDRLLAMFDIKWPHVDRDHEIEQFINYWHAEGKTKLDWDKAFQVWMGRAESRAKTQRSWTAEKQKTNSERNIERLRAKMALLANEQKELEDGQATSGTVVDFGLNLRSAEDI